MQGLPEWGKDLPDDVRDLIGVATIYIYIPMASCKFSFLRDLRCFKMKASRNRKS